MAMAREEMAAGERWQKVGEITRAACERGDSSLLWAVNVAKCMQAGGWGAPSIELGTILANYLCSSPTTSSSPLLLLRSYLHHAMATHLASSFHVLALLTSRLVPYRLQYPEMYSLYIDLASTYVFDIGYTKTMPCCDRVIKAVDEALQLSLCGMQTVELGTAVVHFLFSLVWKLVDASSVDWGLPPSMQVGVSSQCLQNQIVQEASMELDDKRTEEREQLRRNNSIAAIELVTKILHDKKTSALLRLAQRHLSDNWNIFAQRLQLLETLMHDVSTTASKAALEALKRISGSLKRIYQVSRPCQLPVMKALVETSSYTTSFGNCSGLGRSATWLPFDIFMEDAMDFRRVPSRPIVEALAEMVKSLQVVQDASWHDTFLALWLSALRLVQREREPVEGPKTHIESRLCMLLSIVPLAASMLIENEEKQIMGSSENSCIGAADEKEKPFGTRRAAFISSLQILGQFEGLLSPPQYVAVAAQQAAAAAGAFLAGVGATATGYGGLNATDANSGPKTVGNLQHLIIETCIARGLIDTSACIWSGSTGQVTGGSQSVSSHSSPWSVFMDGASLTGALKNSLMATPATSVAELEKIYQYAINGPEDERAAAVSIVCGASLLRGWNVQEHVVQVIIRLLSPPAPSGSQNNSHLVSHAPMLLAVLNGLISIDAVHILSFYGMYPELAAALMPVCEFFGSLPPAVSLTTSCGEDVPVFLLFSLAFLLLVKLWKYHRPPFEHRMLGLGAPLGSNRSLEYLLFRYNIQTSSSMGSPVEKAGKDDEKVLTNLQSLAINLPHRINNVPQISGSSSHSITLDSFPRLKAWYLQHQACIASPLSGLVRGDPMHQVTDRLLSMMMQKMGKGASVPTTASNSSNAVNMEDAGVRPLLSAWDLLAAIPFVVDAVLTACGYGKLSPRDLITGLRDLVDFFPASLATIVSYFAAEVTRGLWKPASMNGTDWPNPAANLFSLDAEIREMLAATGVTAPSTGLAGNAPVALPLPLAAFVSLTITYKGEKLSDAVLGVCGPALESAAGSIPWPSMAIVGALWAQKVRKWHDFILFSSSQTIFKQDKNAVIQLLRSCFSVTLGNSGTASKLTVYGGVGALLGHGNWSRLAPGGRHPVSPGILYLRIYPALHDIMFVCEEILTLVVKAAKDLATLGAEIETFGGLIKHASRLRCVYPSLPTTVTRLTQASTLGASLLWISGGTALVQLLYTEVLLTWFLSGGKAQNNLSSCKKGSSALFEGYGLAHFAFLSGVLAWGISETNDMQSPRLSSSAGGTGRRLAVHIHLEFLASVLNGNIPLRCEQTTWKSYIIGFSAFLVTFAPSWISETKVDTLKRLATGLRLWHEHDLAIALLERGGPTSINAAAEFILGY